MIVVHTISRALKFTTLMIILAIGGGLFSVGMIAFDVVSTTGQGGTSVLLPSISAMLIGAAIMAATVFAIRNQN